MSKYNYLKNAIFEKEELNNLIFDCQEKETIRNFLNELYDNLINRLLSYPKNNFSHDFKKINAIKYFLFLDSKSIENAFLEYNFCVSWGVSGNASIRAKSDEDAIMKYILVEDIIPLDDDGNYIDDSYQLNLESSDYRKMTFIKNEIEKKIF